MKIYNGNAMEVLQRMPAESVEKMDPFYREEGIAIYNNDCFKVLPRIPKKSVDLVLTDPPYNSPDIGPNHRKYDNGVMKLPIEKYQKFCAKWIKKALQISGRVIFTPGIANICFYPQPDWVVCWHKPAAISFNGFGGFNAWEPIFLYGKIPKNKRLRQDYILENTLNYKKGPEREHPCPKPLKLIKKLIDIFSLENDLILDPFAGSFTTGCACKELNRRFIGIEISQRYCEIGIKRLQDTIYQPPLFKEQD